MNDGILTSMKRSILCALVMAVIVTPPASAADPPLVDGVSGAPVVWSDWVAKRGPVAILVWASWAPDASSVLDTREALAAASREAGLHFVLLDVQESLEDARKALAGTDLSWIHDRHGALLKRYRVIEVPSVLVVSADGAVRGRHEATPAGITGGAR